MKKTYPRLGWSEIMETIEHANALGLLQEARLVPVGGGAAPPAPDWDLTVEFDGFDAEPDVAHRRFIGLGVEVFREPVQTIEISQGEPPEDGPSEGPAKTPPEPEPAPEEIPEPEIELVPEPGGDPDPEPPAIAAEASAVEETRLCTKCGDENGPKPFSEFGTNKNAKDGRSKICIDCKSGMQKAANEKKQERWREKRRDEREEAEARKQLAGAGRASHAPPEPENPPEPGKVQKKRCEVCGPELGPRPLTEFAKRANKTAFPDGRAKVCRECGLKSSSADPQPAIPDGDLGNWEEKLEGIATGPRHTREARPVVFCANGDDCAAPGIDGPTKMRSGKKQGDICDACEEATTGRFGMGA